MKGKIYVYLLIVMVSASCLYSETSMLIHKSDGTRERVPISTIDRITFDLDDYTSLADGHSISMKKFQELSASIAFVQGVTSVEFKLPEKRVVEINIYDVGGRCVRNIKKGSMEPGDHMLNFDSRTLTSGNYIMSLRAGNKKILKKLIIVK